MRRLVLAAAAAAVLAVAAGAALWRPGWLPFSAGGTGAPELHTVAVGDRQLRYRDEGPREAPAVVLLPARGIGVQSWDGWAAALRDRLRVIRFEVAGGGPADIEVLEGLAVALKLAPLSLAAQNEGGALALAYAARHPERVRRLVLVAPQPGDQASLDAVRARTLILWGGKDADTPPADGFRLQNALPDAELKIYEEGTHRLAEELVARTAEDAAAFLLR